MPFTMKKGGILILLLALFSGCDVRTSSVPNAPVQISVNTKQAFFVHFIPDNIGNYLVVNSEGYRLNGKDFLPRTFVDYYGYAGVVIFIDNNCRYSAFDLCCPNCVDRAHPTEVNGMMAICPICGEEYDLSWGLGVPMKHNTKEALKHYSCFYSGDVLTVRN